MNTAERQELKKELARYGIKGEYLKEWQPREDLWRHAPKLNINGAQTRPAGAIVPNQPADMDHKLRMAVKGVLPWKPMRDCQCKACRERDWDSAVVNEDGHISILVKEEVSPFQAFEDPPKPIVPDETKCPDCDFVVRADSKSPKASMRFHRLGKHCEAMVA